MYIFMSSKEYNTPQKTASIFLQYAKHKLGSVSNWNLEMLVFEERGKSEYPEKNLSEHLGQEPTTNSTHILYDAESRNQTRATFVGGECSHHCTIPAPLKAWNGKSTSKIGQIFSIEKACTLQLHIIATLYEPISIWEYIFRVYPFILGVWIWIFSPKPHP